MKRKARRRISVFPSDSNTIELQQQSSASAYSFSQQNSSSDLASSSRETFSSVHSSSSSNHIPIRTNNPYRLQSMMGMQATEIIDYSLPLGELFSKSDMRFPVESGSCSYSSQHQYSSVLHAGGPEGCNRSAWIDFRDAWTALAIELDGYLGLIYDNRYPHKKIIQQLKERIRESGKQYKHDRALATQQHQQAETIQDLAACMKETIKLTEFGNTIQLRFKRLEGIFTRPEQFNALDQEYEAHALIKEIDPTVTQFSLQYQTQMEGERLSDVFYNHSNESLLRILQDLEEISAIFGEFEGLIRKFRPLRWISTLIAPNQLPENMLNEFSEKIRLNQIRLDMHRTVFISLLYERLNQFLFIDENQFQQIEGTLLKHIQTQNVLNREEFLNFMIQKAPEIDEEIYQQLCRRAGEKIAMAGSVSVTEGDMLTAGLKELLGKIPSSSSKKPMELKTFIKEKRILFFENNGELMPTDELVSEFTEILVNQVVTKLWIEGNQEYQNYLVGKQLIPETHLDAWINSPLLQIAAQVEMQIKFKQRLCPPYLLYALGCVLFQDTGRLNDSEMSETRKRVEMYASHLSKLPYFVAYQAHFNMLTRLIYGNYHPKTDKPLLGTVAKLSKELLIFKKLIAHGMLAEDKLDPTHGILTLIIRSFIPQLIKKDFASLTGELAERSIDKLTSRLRNNMQLCEQYIVQGKPENDLDIGNVYQTINRTKSIFEKLFCCQPNAELQLPFRTNTELRLHYIYLHLQENSLLSFYTEACKYLKNFDGSNLKYHPIFLECHFTFDKFPETLLSLYFEKVLNFYLKGLPQSNLSAPIDDDTQNNLTDKDNIYRIFFDRVKKQLGKQKTDEIFKQKVNEFVQILEKSSKMNIEFSTGYVYFVEAFAADEGTRYDFRLILFSRLAVDPKEELVKRIIECYFKNNIFSINFFPYDRAPQLDALIDEFIEAEEDLLKCDVDTHLDIKKLDNYSLQYLISAFVPSQREIYRESRFKMLTRMASKYSGTPYQTYYAAVVNKYIAYYREDVKKYDFDKTQLVQDAYDDKSFGYDNMAVPANISEPDEKWDPCIQRLLRFFAPKVRELAYFIKGFNQELKGKSSRSTIGWMKVIMHDDVAINDLTQLSANNDKNGIEKYLRDYQTRDGKSMSSWSIFLLMRSNVYKAFKEMLLNFAVIGYQEPLMIKIILKESATVWLEALAEIEFFKNNHDVRKWASHELGETIHAFVISDLNNQVVMPHHFLLVSFLAPTSLYELLTRRLLNIFSEVSTDDLITLTTNTKITPQEESIFNERLIYTQLCPDIKGERGKWVRYFGADNARILFAEMQNYITQNAVYDLWSLAWRALVEFKMEDYLSDNIYEEFAVKCQRSKIVLEMQNNFAQISLVPLEKIYILLIDQNNKTNGFYSEVLEDFHIAFFNLILEALLFKLRQVNSPDGIKLHTNRFTALYTPGSIFDFSVFQPIVTQLNLQPSLKNLVTVLEVMISLSDEISKGHALKLPNSLTSFMNNFPSYKCSLSAADQKFYSPIFTFVEGREYLFDESHEMRAIMPAALMASPSRAGQLALTSSANVYGGFHARTPTSSPTILALSQGSPSRLPPRLPPRQQLRLTQGPSPGGSGAGAN